LEVGSTAPHLLAQPPAGALFHTGFRAHRIPHVVNAKAGEAVVALFAGVKEAPFPGLATRLDFGSGQIGHHLGQHKHVRHIRDAHFSHGHLHLDAGDVGVPSIFVYAQVGGSPRATGDQRQHQGYGNLR